MCASRWLAVGCAVAVVACGGSTEDDGGRVGTDAGAGAGSAVGGAAGSPGAGGASGASAAGGSGTPGGAAGRAGAPSTGGGGGTDAPDAGRAGAPATCEPSACVPVNAGCPSGTTESALACAKKKHKCCAPLDAGATEGGTCLGVTAPCSSASECCSGLQCDQNPYQPSPTPRCCIPAFTQPCTSTEQCCYGTCVGGICWFDA
jgi:hypothetical protein